MTTDGGGWTLIAKYISNLQLFSFHEAKHQQQNSSQGADLSTPPNLGDTNTYGHINFTWFEINGRSLKLQCRTSTTGTWFSHTRNDIFQNWTPGDKNTYGNAQGWGVIGRYGQHSRSNHFICGQLNNGTTGQYPGIAYCKGAGSSGSWANHTISFSFTPNTQTYGGGLSIGCNGSGIDTGTSGQWQGRIWVR
jgi:hypothetical protein